MVESFELPWIDLGRVIYERNHQGCWEVVNRKLLEKVQKERREVFHWPFASKAEGNFLNLSAK